MAREGESIKVKKEHFSSELNLVFNSIPLVLALLCAILSENSVVKGAWIVCSLVWGVRIIMDIRKNIKRKRR